MTPLPLDLVPCRGTKDEAQLVMRWRNDPTTLRMFYHHEPKRWPDFWEEYRERYLADPTLPPAFAVHEGQRVAFLRFQRVPAPGETREPAADISINVDPAARGRGLGVRALVACDDYLAARGVKTCVAEVRLENLASRRAFARAGWRVHDEIEKEVVDTGERCRVERLVREL